MTYSTAKSLPKQNILGVEVTNASESEILEYVINSVVNFTKKYYITTPNPEMVVLAHKKSSFKTILNNARLALSDGTGLILAGKILGKPLKSRVTGTDLMVSLCREVSKQPITVGFLGAGPKVAELAAECLSKKYPGLRVSFIGREWEENIIDGRRSKVEGRTLKVENRKSIHPLPSIIKDPPSTFYHPPSSIDILFVAFGFPKQEEWMAQNLDKLPVKVMMGVGGAFDYISGLVPRAPQWMRSIGLEWLFRLIVQPWRIKRQFALIEFIWLVFLERIRSIAQR